MAKTLTSFKDFESELTNITVESDEKLNKKVEDLKTLISTMRQENLMRQNTLQAMIVESRKLHLNAVQNIYNLLEEKPRTTPQGPDLNMYKNKMEPMFKDHWGSIEFKDMPDPDPEKFKLALDKMVGQSMAIDPKVIKHSLPIIDSRLDRDDPHPLDETTGIWGKKK